MKTEHRIFEGTAGKRSRKAVNNDSGKGHKKRAAAGIILLIILAVIAVVAVKFRKAADEKHQASLEEASVAASVAESIEAAKAAEIPVVPWTECTIPELTFLAEDYFRTRLAGDTSHLREIFGRSDTSDDGDLQRKLKAQADWIQTFKNIKVYTVPGLDSSSKLCLVLYDIDFRRTDTMAPGVMYFYAVKDGEAGYHFVENPVSEIHAYIEAELAEPSAAALINDSNKRLKEALDADSTLALIYDSFRSGEIYKESNLEVDKEQQVGLSVDFASSVLVSDEVLADIADEAAQAAAAEASLAAQDELEISKTE